MFAGLGSAREPQDVAAYLNHVAQKCQKHYFAAADAVSGAGQVTCELECDGNIKNVKVIAGPGYKGAKDKDELGYAALRESVTKAAPFPKPPKKLQCPARLLIVFDKKGNASAKLDQSTSHISTGK